MNDPLVYRELGRLSEAVQGLRDDFTEVKILLTPLISERQERTGMAKLFRTVLPMVMAGVVGAIGTHTPDWLAQLLGPK